MNKKNIKTSIQGLIQDFFLKRLMTEQNASYQTILSYRDTFRLFLQFLEKTNKTPPSCLTLADLDLQSVLNFLDHLESERGNSARSRNNRLAAIRSFMSYMSVREPTAIATAQQILAIPMKRYNRKIIGFLSRKEIEAILISVDQKTWNGHRDHVMLSTLYNTGARVSEAVNLKRKDVILQQKTFIRFFGKGRKERNVPLWRSTTSYIKKWLLRIGDYPDQPLFPNRFGNHLTRSGVEHRIHLYVKKAQDICQSLKKKRVSPHIFRHTTAMHLLQSGVDISVIALWLGHEDINTTHKYIEADLSMKEKALKCLHEPKTKSIHYKPDDQLLAFLKGL